MIRCSVLANTARSTSNPKRRPFRVRSQDLRAAACVPQCTEQQRRADGAPAHRRVAVAAFGFRQRQQRLGEAAGGLDQPVEAAGRGEAVETAERGDDALPGSVLRAIAFDNLQIGLAIGARGSTEHLLAWRSIGIT